MKKVFRVAVLPLLALALFAAIPALSGAAAPPDMGECHPVTNPTIPPASQVNPGALPGAGSQPWAYQAGDGGQVGIKGANGFLVVKGSGSSTSPSISLQGRLNAADLNGDASATPNGAQKASVCMSVQNQRIKVSAP